MCLHSSLKNYVYKVLFFILSVVPPSPFVVSTSVLGFYMTLRITVYEFFKILFRILLHYCRTEVLTLLSAMLDRADDLEISPCI